MAALTGSLKRTNRLSGEVAATSASVSARAFVAAATEAEAYQKAEKAVPNPSTSTKLLHSNSESITTPAQSTICTADSAQDQFNASMYAFQTAGQYHLKECLTLEQRGHTWHLVSCDTI